MRSESALSTGVNDPVVALASELIATDSTNPQLVPGGAGEVRVAKVIEMRLRRAGLAVEISEPVPGRPNVVGRLRVAGTGAALLLCGHTDVVDAQPAGSRPQVRDRRLYGRGPVEIKV